MKVRDAVKTRELIT